MLVINEPLAEYKTTGWRTQVNKFSFDDNIADIENGTIQFCQPSSLQIKILVDNPKIKLSELRGKISRMTEKEIDDQISNLRTEWDRNI
jgi:hypothetical protein